MATKKKTSILITPDAPALILRICRPDGSSRNGFMYPELGPVSCPDWKETEECGNGLHGWLNGEGDHSVADSDLFTNPDSLWKAIEVPAYVQLDGKVKFPAGNVVCSGDRLLVTEYLKANGCTGSIIGGTATAGDAGTATAGDEGAILIKRWNGKHYRFTLGNIGEDKDAAGDLLLAGTAYKLDDDGQFIKA